MLQAENTLTKRAARGGEAQGLLEDGGGLADDDHPGHQAAGKYRHHPVEGPGAHHLSPVQVGAAPLPAAGGGAMAAWKPSGGSASSREPSRITAAKHPQHPEGAAQAHLLHQHGGGGGPQDGAGAVGSGAQAGRPCRSGRGKRRTT